MNCSLPDAVANFMGAEPTFHTIFILIHLAEHWPL